MPQDATSASPEFRNGLVSLVCYAGWYSPANDEEVISEVVRYGNERMYQYGTGVYYNENDYYLQNWQVSLFIELYPTVLHEVQNNMKYHCCIFLFHQIG